MNTITSRTKSCMVGMYDLTYLVTVFYLHNSSAVYTQFWNLHTFMRGKGIEKWLEPKKKEQIKGFQQKLFCS